MNRYLTAIRLLRRIAIFTLTTALLLSCAKQQELPNEEIPVPINVKTIDLMAFGQVISVSYEANLATSVEAIMVPAVPISDQILFSESHPSYAQLRFLDYPVNSAYQLPVLPVEDNVPQIMVFQTKDFPGYGDDNPMGFVNQFQVLAEVVKTGVNLNRCNEPISDYESSLPFLPWINMKQTFCAQPQIVEFAGGRGIRYLTYYAQSPEPTLEGRVFYIFQGIKNDGQFYISVLFPIQTGIFPAEPSPCPKCGDPNYNTFPEWDALLKEQLTQLNARSENDFAPPLTILDEVVKSIYFKP